MEEDKETVSTDSEEIRENHCAETLVISIKEREVKESQPKSTHILPECNTEKEANLLNKNGMDQTLDSSDIKPGNDISVVQSGFQGPDLSQPLCKLDNFNPSVSCEKSNSVESSVEVIKTSESDVAESSFGVEVCPKARNSNLAHEDESVKSNYETVSQKMRTENNSNSKCEQLKNSISNVMDYVNCNVNTDNTSLDAIKDKLNFKKEKVLSIECKDEMLEQKEDKSTSMLIENKSDGLILVESKIEISVPDDIASNNSFLEKEKLISSYLKEEKVMSCCSEKQELLNTSLEDEENIQNAVAENKTMSSATESQKVNDNIDENNFKFEEKTRKSENKLESFKNEENEPRSEIESHLNAKNNLKTIDVKNDLLQEKCLKNENIAETGAMDTITDLSLSVIIDQKERNKEGLHTSNSIQEGNSFQSNINTSATSTELDGNAESISRNENDSGEIMDTEMINCSEIEMIDLSENEFQKEKDIDRIGIDSNDIDLKDEGKDDILEISPKRVTEFSVQDKNHSVPFNEKIDYLGHSEEETITGDTERAIEKNKNEDVCIIPDDVTLKAALPTSERSHRNTLKTDECLITEKTDVKVIEKTSNSEYKNSEAKDMKKKDDVDFSKSRPLRTAAKLAGNKIRSLVLNVCVPEEQGLTNRNKEDEVENEDANVNSEESHRMCAHCKEVKLWKFLMVYGNINQYLCSEQCSEAFAKTCQSDRESQSTESPLDECFRKCAQCHIKVTLDEKCLFWETMNFCNEDCLGNYQNRFGSSCANCKGNVFSTSLGKYCVRFGCDIKQFCSGTCLEEYKKGLKVCSYCQKDMSSGMEGFLAPVGDKGQFKDFCTQSCMEKYEQMSSSTPAPDVNEECAVCSNYKPVRVEVDLDNKTHKLCSEPCFAAFKFVNNITEGQCNMCKKYFDRTKTRNLSIFYDDSLRLFCCKTCMNVYILAHRKIIPCNWCKVKKYNFDMIRKGTSSGQMLMMCSLNCLTLYQLSTNSVNSRHIKCDFCMTVAPSQYHLAMSDASTRNFCSYSCVISFQNQYPKRNDDLTPGNEEQNLPIPTGLPKKVISRRSQESSCVPVISSVQSLATPMGTTSPTAQHSVSRTDGVSQKGSLSQSLPISGSVNQVPIPPPQIYQQIITKPPVPKKMKNKSILCKPYSHTKGVSCRPHPCVKETQTDQSLSRKFLIPIPVPIYVPCPMHMFATPFPVPVPFPLPVPVPIFIPTTRNSAKGIMKEIKKIQEKIPTDPFEAELLMMAEMVAGEKKQDPTDSESEEGNEGEDGGDGTFSPDNVDSSNTFGDDMLQMALKMASELEEPAVDMESVLTSNTITTQSQPPVDPNKALYSQVNTMPMNRGRKRSVRGSRNGSSGTPSKRGRRTSGSVDVPLLPPPEPVPPPRIEVEKPDADMCLKYTFGVNAWRHWVMQKNAELEKAAMTNRKIKLFKPELLQLTADELNFSLCLFVKEVRKPNGTEYAPDTIYYLCLGIQQYLFENGRIDNIFTDSYYEKFTDCLDEVAKKFAALYNDSQYIVTRVEEEHLWESKQLGAHSPHVLLSTLMFFNTKHFNLVTVEEHMQLSFSHIMKHWKRNPNTPGVAKVPGSRNVLLRFYPPQSALEANSRKKKVYEQQENEENPLRCPVKLYEFYLSKCPESVKTRNDVFYLLPERSCVPDSPVWYSTMALGKEPLMKMLHRVKMVKEINIALLSC